MFSKKILHTTALTEHGKLLLKAASVPIGAAVLSLPMSEALAQKAEGAYMLEEIVVSARKRSESMQTVPVAVSAMTSSEIDRSFATDLGGIKGIPNVQMDQAPAYKNVASFFIRGIGYQDIDLTFEPAVGVVVDGIFLGKANGSLLDTFDLESIEILRGPQGTLFGKNTIAGVVNVKTKNPTFDGIGGEVKANIGDYGRQSYRASVNVPLSDQTAVRLSGLSDRSNGFFKNTATGHNTGGDDTLMGRFKLLHEASDTFNLVITGDLMRERSETSGMNNSSFNLGEPRPLTNALPLLGFPADDDGDLLAGGADIVGPYDIDAWGLSVEANWSLDSFDVTAISGYRDQEEETNSNLDGEALPLFHLPRTANFDQFYNELRAASTFSDNFDFVVGINYMRQEHHQNLGFFLDSYFLGANVGAPGDLATILDTPQSQTVDTYGVFLQGNYQLSEAWRLTAGIRYNEDQKDYTFTETGFADNNLSLEGLSLGSVFAGAPTIRQTKDFEADFDEVTWRLGTDYQINDDLFAYASVATGFKAGGFNGRATTFLQVGPYDPETVTSYEMGLKATFLDGRARVNTAIFNNEYEDLQIEILQAIGGTSVTLVENAAAATISGIEIEGTFLLGESLTLQTTIGLLDAEYDDFFADVFNRGYDTDNSDLDLRRAPEVTMSAGLLYETDLDFGSVYWQADWAYNSDYETNVQNYAFGHSESKHIFNASLGYRTLDDKFGISAYVRNIGDEVRVLNSNPVPPFASFNQGSDPRHFGIELSYSY